MKILILQDDFPPKSFGGAENIVFNLVKKLKKEARMFLLLQLHKIKMKKEK